MAVYYSGDRAMAHGRDRLVRRPYGNSVWYKSGRRKD